MAKWQLDRFLVRSPFYQRGDRGSETTPVASESQNASTAAIAEPSTDSADRATPSPQANSQTVSSGNGVWGLLLLWSIAFLACGGSGIYAIRLLTTVPPLPECQAISPLAADSERLYCAEQAAKSGELEHLAAAVALVENWSAEHPLSSDGRRLMKQWSRDLLRLARQRMNESGLDAAVAVVDRIPETSPVYEEARNQIDIWTNSSNQGEQIYQSIRSALENKQWQQASNQVQRLANLKDPYWKQKRFVELKQLIESEKQAWRRLSGARELAKQNTPEKLEQAIDLVRAIGIESYARKEAQAEMARWSRRLLNVAEEKLARGEIEGAIATAKRVPKDASVYPEARDFIVLSQATAKAAKDNIWALTDARAMANQIGADRPLHSEAQAKLALWQASIEDKRQIQLAEAIATIGQPFAFNWASKVALMVERERPQRIQAQTKIAHWRKQIQRIEDQPYIIRARQLAQTETVDSLKAAVAEAARVEKGRPRRIEAQTLIAQWNQRIQIMEDSPLLERARVLATAGDFDGAIEIAEKIAPDRVLYDRAQEAIYGWVVQVQVAEDRSVLDDGYWLASQGRYSAAINTASTIRWGRPLYYEAREAIARWDAELERLYAPPPPPSPESYYLETEQPALPNYSNPQPRSRTSYQAPRRTSQAEPEVNY